MVVKETVNCWTPVSNFLNTAKTDVGYSAWEPATPFVLVFRQGHTLCLRPSTYSKNGQARLPKIFCTIMKQGTYRRWMTTGDISLRSGCLDGVRIIVDDHDGAARQHSGPATRRQARRGWPGTTSAG